MKNLLYSTIPVIWFVLGTHGREYGVTRLGKLRLLSRFVFNNARIETTSSFAEHLVMADELLKVPKRLEGSVIELGCYRGGSTANLSVVCGLVGRKLVVFDSFSGLPEPAHEDKALFNMHSMSRLKYRRGQYAATLEQVRDVVAKYGRVDACEFVEGFFHETLPGRNEKYVMVFEDADLVSSVMTALQYVWPRLQHGCKFFTHEAQDFQIASLFFDGAYWQGEFSVPAPGLVGAGIGLPLGPGGSPLGYTVKT